MYVLDTNILSEIMKKRSDTYAVYWLQDHPDEVCTTAITIEELYFGVKMLPEGKRKETLKKQTEELVQDLAGRTLPLDAFSAYLCAELRVQELRSGRTPEIHDLMIAAIAKANNCAVATRNVKDFGHLGVEVVNPFEYVPPAYGRVEDAD